MGSKLAEAYMEIRARQSRLPGDLAKAKAMVVNSLQSIRGVASGALGLAVSGMATAGVLAAAGAAGAAIAGAAGAAFSVKLASDAEEAASKFGFVFGSAAESTGRSIDQFAAAAGRSRNEMRAMAADVGALIQPLGLGSDATGRMSSQIVGLASDLASFHNVTDADALTALRAGLVGESEPLRRFGIQLNEVRVQAEAMRLGLAKTKGSLSSAAKAQSIMSLVMQDTRAAQGDAIRTSGSFANQLRGLQGAAVDLGTEVGQLFLPAVTRIVSAFRETVLWAQANTESFRRWGALLGETVGGVIAGFKTLAANITGFFAEKFNQVVSRATGGATTSVKDFVTKTLEWSATLATNLPKMWSLIRTTAELTWRTMTNSVRQTLNTWRAHFAGIWGGIAAGARSLVDYFRAAFKEIGNLGAALGAGIKAAWNAAFSGENPMTAFSKAFGDTLAAQKDEAIPKFGEAIRKGYEKAFEAVKGEFRDDPMLEELQKKMKDQLKEFDKLRQQQFGIGQGSAKGVVPTSGAIQPQTVQQMVMKVGKEGLVSMHDRVQQSIRGTGAEQIQKRQLTVLQEKLKAQNEQKKLQQEQRDIAKRQEAELRRLNLGVVE